MNVPLLFLNKAQISI